MGRRCGPVAVIAGLALFAAEPALGQPTASFAFSPAAPLTGEPVTFVSTSSGVIAPQLWDLDGDGSCDDAEGASAQRTFPSAGAYSVKLCVTDGTDSATLTRKVTVLNRPPLASLTYAPASPLVGDTLILTSTSVDPDGPITGQTWDLDADGAFDDGSGEVASLALRAAGTYTVRLLVSDRDGASSVAAATIAVARRPPPLLSPFPVVRAVATITPRGTRIRMLAIEAPASARVRVRCRGRGCPFRRLTRTAARASNVVRVRRLRRHTLRPGAIVQVWVMKPDTIGKYTRFRIRRRLPPSRVDRCLAPGARLPVRCPRT